MIYLDRVPERAAIHEAVEIAKRRGHKGIAGMVNGVLRSIQREGVPSVDEIKDPVERLAIATSHPVWLTRVDFCIWLRNCRENVRSKHVTTCTNSTCEC